MWRRLVLFAAVFFFVGLFMLGLPFDGERRMVFEPMSAYRPPLKTLLVHFGSEVPHPEVKYPASLFAIFDVGCSATLVGSDALLTSEHCVTMVAMAQTEVLIKIDGVEKGVVCTASTSADIALCKVETPVTGIMFDVIERSAVPARVGRRIHLTGWADPPPSGFFARWWWRIRRRLGIGSPFKEGTGTITAEATLLTVTGDTSLGGAIVLEPGDSGGAGYAVQDAKRTIIGVNKCGGAYCGDGATAATSRLTNVTDSSVAAWIQSWADDNAASVCGFTSTTGCRP